jgi:diguanylate cyclase (GGDEF)-like protein
MDRARRLTGCTAWSLLLLDEAGRELRFAAAKGGAGRADKNFRLKIGEGIAGWVAQHGRPLIIRDLRRDERFRFAADRPTQLRARSLLCVPIVIKHKTIGVLEMINKQDGAPFDATDQDLLTKFADQAAIALERSSLYEQMASLATTDDLTKLYNFRFFDQALEAELERARRYGSAFTIIFLDMDYFKRVNDTKGHLVGSRVLVDVGDLLRRNLRSIDIIARYGGDEFVALMPETPVKSGMRIAQRLHKAIAEHDFLAAEGFHLRLTASFGIAGCPDHSQSKKDLVRLADQAMYLAKNSGRNQVCLAQPVMKPVKRRR